MRDVKYHVVVCELVWFDDHDISLRLHHQQKKQSCEQLYAVTDTV